MKERLVWPTTCSLLNGNFANYGVGFFDPEEVEELYEEIKESISARR